MEDLLAYALLFYEDLGVTEERYLARLDQLFLASPEDRFLLEMECQTDMGEAMREMRRQVNNGQTIDRERFGRTLMGLLKGAFQTMDLRDFSQRAYLLWRDLPWQMQNEEPFWTLSYADDPLSWGDEAQSRFLYEKMLSYYEESSQETAIGSKAEDIII